MKNVCFGFGGCGLVGDSVTHGFGYELRRL